MTTTAVPEETIVETVLMPRIVAASLFAVFCPIVVGLLIALATRENSWRVTGGFEVLVLAGGTMAGFGAISARLGKVFPTAFGIMTGIGLAVGALVRDGSSVGFFLALLFAGLGGLLAGSTMPARAAASRAPAAMIAITLLGASVLGVVGRITPTNAALSAGGQGSVILDGVKVGRGAEARRHVLVGRRTSGGHLDLAVVSLAPKGIGSWSAIQVRRLPEDCAIRQLATPPQVRMADDLGTVYPHFASATGVFVSLLDAETACAVSHTGGWFNDALVVGRAPDAASVVEVHDLDGEILLRRSLDERGVFLLLADAVDREDLERSAFRMAFRDADDRLVLSVPWPGLYRMDTEAIAVLSGEIDRNELFGEGRRWTDPLIVTVGLMTRDESMDLCGDLFTKSDWVKVGLVQVGETSPRFVRVLAPHHERLDDAEFPEVRRGTRTTVVQTPTAPCFN